jgi:hypothetical protein
MSQSDYIRYIKTSAQLNDITSLNPVLDAQDYTSFLQYNLESTIPNTKSNLGRLVSPTLGTSLTSTTQSVIFDMRKNISKCPVSNFPVCTNTNLRQNRVNKCTTNSSSGITASGLSRNITFPVNTRYDKYYIANGSRITTNNSILLPNGSTLLTNIITYKKP